jgi:protein-S-isoprenylcysteine O-methyltransferase Ste14
MLYFLMGVGLDLVLPASFPGPVWLRAVGVILFGAGVGLMLRSWWLFEKAGTAIRPTDEPSKMITSGPYARSRNPMYVAAVLMMLGPSVFLGSLPLLGAALAFFATMHLVHIPFEERVMEEAFGEEYREYALRVTRWL